MNYSPDAFKRYKILFSLETAVPLAPHLGLYFVMCPECNNIKKKNTTALQVNLLKGTWLCQHCSFHGHVEQGSAKKKNPMQWVNTDWHKPDFEYTPLSPKLISWFKSRGISEEVLEKNKITQRLAYITKHEEIKQAIVYPYFYKNELINLKYRDPKRNFQLEKATQPFFYKFDNFNIDHTILVEAEIDTLTLEVCGFNNVIGVPYTPGAKESNYEDNFEYLFPVEKELQSIKKITLAFSNTEQGKRLEEEIARRLGKERCFRVQWPEDIKDLNHLLIQKNSEEVKNLILSARPYPIKGIYEAADVYDKIDSLYDYGLPRGVNPGWQTLEDHYTIKEGQWTLVTGIPGHGKSNFLDAMLVNVATTENWRFGMFSPENQPIERHFANLMEKYVDAPFSFGATERMSKELKEKAKSWINDHFYVILPDEDAGNWSVDGILELAKALVFRKGIKGLVIDPWNELDHSRSQGLTETEHISQALTKIRQFARSYGVHIWVVAHPAKLYKDSDGKYPVPTPYDVAGSSHWNNKADNAISVWRNRGGKDEEVSDIHIQKIRFKEVGRVGIVSLRYNKITGKFIDDIDQAKRQEALEKMLELPTDDLRIFSKKPFK